MAAVAVVVALSAISIFNSTTQNLASTEKEDVSPARARAIGARWRQVKSDALAQRYADALISAGLYDRLLKEIDEGGLFAGDDRSRLLFRAEALLRQRRYDDAERVADQEENNPWVSFIRARATYALTPSEDAIAEDLRHALRGPDALAIEAWLFRARVALDANDIDTAKSASRRAREAGADEKLVEAIDIEGLIRNGDIASAESMLLKNAGKKRANLTNARLTALISLRQGDGRSAVRRLSAVRDDDGPTSLLLALAKWRAGDIAQAQALVERELAVAPKNWMALDLAAAIARDMDRNADADRLLARLSKVRPALAMLRRLRLQPDPDEAFMALVGLSEGTRSSGVGVALLGEGAVLPYELIDAKPNERALIRLGAALASGETEGLNPNDANIGGGNDPVALTLAGAGFETLGEWAKADEMYVRASVVSPDFFRPVMRAAALARQRGANRRAITLLKKYSMAHPDHNEARLELAQAYTAEEDFRMAAETFAHVAPDIIFETLDTAEAYATAATYAGRQERDAMLAAAAKNATNMKILGGTLFIAGEDKEAAVALRKALIADPNDAETAGRYADAMAKIGRGGEAKSLLDAIKKMGVEPAHVEESGALEPEYAKNKVKNQP